MPIDPIALAALAKFNQNKNGKHFPVDVDPGTYPIDISFSLLGTLSKGELIIEDVDTNPQAMSDVKSGLRIVTGADK